MSFTIVKDHPSLLKYIESLQAKNSDALGFLPRVAFEHAAESGQLFLGLLNGEPCGYIMAGSGYQGVLRRWQVCIQYDARRRLYGAMLVAAVEKYGEDLGCTHPKTPNLLKLKCVFTETKGFNTTATLAAAPVPSVLMPNGCQMAV